MAVALNEGGIRSMSQRRQCAGSHLIEFESPIALRIKGGGRYLGESGMQCQTDVFSSEASFRLANLQPY